MHHDLTVWGRRDAFNVQKVMWLVGELNLSHHHISIGGRFGGLNTPQFLAMNPHGHIPVISDNGNVVWESHSILRYLAARYGRDRFWSNSEVARLHIDPWMDWQQTALQPDFLTGVFWGYYRTPEKDRDWLAINASIERCNQHFILLDSILKDQYFLVGNSISLADITVGTTLYRYFEININKPIIKHVDAWYQRLRDRPAYEKHVMIPFSEMKGRLSY